MIARRLKSLWTATAMGRRKNLSWHRWNLVTRILCTIGRSPRMLQSDVMCYDVYVTWWYTYLMPA